VTTPTITSATPAQTARLQCDLKTAPATQAAESADANARQIIERDYEELKQELGLGHFEGRGWRGFHHHATLCIAAQWVPGS
jgi:SRSO17 transposase